MDKLLRQMLRIRLFEEEIIGRYSELEMRCPVHLCNGQEAVAVGACAHLSKDDWIFPPHRNHHWYLAKGGDMNALAAEMYGKSTGCSDGMGGSMHVVDLDAGVSLSSSIVTSNIPVAVGAAWAYKMRGTNQIAVAPFGDGAMDEGAFWESLNFAVLKKLPVLFVLEDNGYATQSPIETRFAGSVMHKVESFGALYFFIKGNDPFKISNAAGEAIRLARMSLPTFLHCKVHRWMEHVGPMEDFHLGYRDETPIREDQEVDILASLLYDSEIEQEVQEAFEFAKCSPFPESCQI